MKKRIVVFAGNECKKEKEEYYFGLAYKTGRLLAEAGFTVVTGGGPGLMNEICQGAYDAGGETIGVCLYMAGRRQSKFLSKKFLYHRLNPRQEKLISLGDGFIALPGGIGTLFEIAEILALKRKLEISKDTRCILVDGYYQEFKSLVRKMQIDGFVAGNFSKLYDAVSTPQEAVKIMKERLYAP